jgi:glutamate synthase domain-containing protein 1
MQRIAQALRQTYGQLLMNGPFTIILARTGEMMALGDRIRLRPLVVGTKGPILYASSELSAMHVVEPHLDQSWIPDGGEMVSARLGQPPDAPNNASPWKGTMMREAQHA